MVLFLFIGLRESIIVSFVIPLAILSTLGLMNAFGVTFNTISLFSLVLSVGMLVDNGVVIMENIDRLRLMGVDSEMAAEAGTNQIAPAVTSSTLTTLAAFFPLLLTAGIMGDFIRDIPKVVIFALSASLFIALTVTPILSARLLKQHRSIHKEKQHPYIQKYGKMLSIIIVFILGMYSFKYSNTGAFEFGILSWLFGTIFAVLMYLKLYRSRKDNKHPLVEWYGEKLYWIISSRKRKLAVVGISITLFIISMLLIPFGLLKVEMFGATDSTRLYIDINAPKGTTLENTSAIAEEVEKRLFKSPEIKSFVSNIGAYGADSLSDFSANSGSTPNLARITIDLYEKDYREKTSMQLAKEFREILKDIPGAEIKVQELASGPPTDKPIYVRIKGENLEDLKQVAKDYALTLESIQGTRDIEDGIEIGAPELQVRVNKAKAASLGLDDMTIAFGVRNSIYGINATTFRHDQDEIDVVIRTTKERLKTVEDINNLYFYSRSGQTIPFSQVAEIVDSESLNTINHEELKRLISVTADIDANLTAGEVLETFKNAISDYPLPEGVTIEYGGEMEDMQESFTDMFTNMIIAAILVYLILAMQFNSLSQPLIILFTVPLGLIGVMPGLAITGHKFDFLAFIGVVALVGIAVNNAIVLVDYINYLRKKGYSINDAVKETGITRFKPVMATTITTVGGILPMTLKQPFFASMGYGLMFGLSVSTILTLVVIPVIYTMADRAKEVGHGLLSKKEMNI
jgi:HAE1 family hydrophobic/amphiphilic exporter-1